ncbi:tryptophan halogenase family protein [Echinimonas agarilytica]|uniref:Tryptophan 7-halogenase n=1 Tax=Echinimonas agarilytica TaxID=1215918 RepID=A0AA41W633_9GAMM|nr:tryptophan halogenase family protein [Echinimonas agarilytica]MCM2679367.1 tryptophan 7-halogenase [Echinimonas agarilytica]
MSNDRVLKLAVVGGGSAGWLTAALVAAQHGFGKGVSVTLIESPDVKTIGVGEGTWPTMRDTLRKIGISETDFIRQCDASFKQGSKFVNWVNDTPGEFFYQPFTTPAGYYEKSIVPYWKPHEQHVSFSNAVCFQEALCEQQRAPKLITTPEYEDMANYGYHLNAGKFSELLKHHCTSVLGVSYLSDHVDHVNFNHSDEIESLTLRNTGCFNADIFIDCTGFSSLLLGQYMEVPFVDKSDVLFIDGALATQVPYEEDDDPIASATHSTAQEAGWIWDIGLVHRRGVGHVFSSKYITREKAELQLREYLRASIGDKADSIEVRYIPIKSGHREVFWKNNCVAIGLSAGFLEPLEASALALVEYAATLLSERLPLFKEAIPIVAQKFNQDMSYHWQRIIDFLKLHYTLSQRNEPFWVANRDEATIPETLKEQLLQWKYRFPESDEFTHTREVFPAAGYQYVLYGMGFKTEVPDYMQSKEGASQAFELMKQNQRITGEFLSRMPTNRELLNKIHEYGLQVL